MNEPPASCSVQTRRDFVWSVVGFVVSLGRPCPVRASERGPGFRIVVHPKNPTSSASRAFLQQAFLKRISEWHDEVGIQPVDQRPDSAVRKEFSKTILDRSVRAVKNYWQQRIFSGRGVPPPELERDSAVIEYVLRHRGAVGYVSEDTELGDVKVVHIR